MKRKRIRGKNLPGEHVLAEFGKNLSDIRKQRELSQEETAYVAGFSRSYYVEVEKGKRNISLINLTKLLNALDVELSDLIKVSKFKKLFAEYE